MITCFEGDYYFLSNSYNSPFEMHNIIFPTVDHYYNAMKTSNYEDFLTISQLSTTQEVYELIQILDIRDDWYDVRDRIMEYGLHKKFENYPLRGQLLDTGNCEIINGNNSDRYWGIILETKKGENKLGKLLMKLRGIIQIDEEARRHPDFKISECRTS